jgi:Fe-S cluster biogenesis protein NfuA
MTEHVAPNYSREEHIRALIEQISAYIEQFHHGSVELVSIEGEIIKVRLGGACSECNLSPKPCKVGRRHYPQFFLTQSLSRLNRRGFPFFTPKA